MKVGKQIGHNDEFNDATYLHKSTAGLQIRKDGIGGMKKQLPQAGVFVTKSMDVVYSVCGITYINSTDPRTPQSGVFSSPGWPESYPIDVHCSLIFIGRENQRVKIKFSNFIIQGISPLCQFDYVDIYAQVSSPEPDARLTSPLLGRFCGNQLFGLPNLIISTKSIIMIDLHSDYRKTDKGFNGTYSFIDGSVYDFGRKVLNEPCSYIISSSSYPQGFITSPTYPGVYPDNLSCSYKFIGRPSQRIKITFVILDLFHGGDYCPYDSLIVYDGQDSSARTIGRFCGYQNETSFFSTNQYLYIEFKTLSGRTGYSNDPFDSNVDFKFERRGFNISYEFSTSFVSTCDMRILSRNGSRGTIRSPGYPSQFPSNVTCHIFFDGFSNEKVLERVKVTFTDFNIPGNMPHNGSLSLFSRCNYGFLSVNYKGNKASSLRDERFCGALLPPDLFSIGPRMMIIFNTDNAKLGRGFSANYEFIPDYGVPGQQVEEGVCKYLYTSRKEQFAGSFNTPRYPAKYPDFVKCTYIFRPAEGERLLLSFDSFSLGKTRDVTICNNADYIEIFEEVSRNNYKRLSRHCGDWYPGPVLSQREIQVVFTPQRNTFNNTGFDARYQFLTQNKLNRNCGTKSISSPGSGDIIRSPGYPEKYKSFSYCNWTIKASRPNNKILLQIFYFHTEGKLPENGVIKETETYGCQNAVLRLHTSPNEPPQEKCGQLMDEVAMSEGDTFNIEFLTSSRALGAKGFKIAWTELHNENSACSGFRCKRTQYCISKELTCNGLPNCGKELESNEVDTSDENESDGCPAAGEFQILHIAIGASISSFFCIILVICGLYHKRKSGPRPQRRSEPAQDHVEVRYVAASSSCNTTDRLLQIDHTEENGHKGSKVNTPLTSPNETPKMNKQDVEKIDLGADQPPVYSVVNRTNCINPRIQKVSIV
ncbi:hypothetical protein FSP39_024226 [Pinctada imbricata]|uniref:CUB domain-containing protein n=1 Tax=Pinctada imbricata TaxID=66713 RepID=A0AA89BWI1_PINIB|nr:hypothetical protein FSP39_024226 [Pinctada imbricata]